MSESTVETIIIIAVMAIIITMYIIAEHQNYTLKKENVRLVRGLHDSDLAVLSYQALADLDGAVIHQMSEYVDYVHDKLAAANNENAELRKRTLAYVAETDSAEPEVKSFDDHVDDVLAIAAQATGGDFIREPEPVLSTQQELMSDDRLLAVLDQASEMFANDPDLRMIEGTFDDEGKPVVTNTVTEVTDLKDLADVVPFKKRGH